MQVPQLGKIEPDNVALCGVVGDKVLVTTKIPGKSPKLALVNNVNTDYVDVQTSDGFERVTRSDVRGSLVLVFPFLGTFLGFAGL